MKIFIGADHRGFQLKKEISAFLAAQGHDVVDVGSFNEESCDYPELGFKVASEVAGTPGARGILVCLTGIGHSIVANKVKGAYAALCYNKEAAKLSRQHNDANVLVLGAKFVDQDEMRELILTWLNTAFEGGRHLRRVNQIKDIENGKKF